MGGSPAPDEETGADSERKWGWFGAQFDSVATGLLFAEDAHIGGWSILENRLASREREIYLDGNTENVLISDQICLDKEGLKLYKDKNAVKREEDIRAQIRMKDIESYEDMGIGAKAKQPIFKKVTSRTETLYGINQGLYAPVTFESGNVWTDDLFAIPSRTKSYFNNLRLGLKFTFNNISESAFSQGFGPNKIRIIPVINGQELGNRFKYYPDTITLPRTGPYSVSATIDFGSFVSEVTGINARIGFKVIMEDFSGTGTANCFCEFSPVIDDVVFETESDVKTIIAPNGFYCYGGNKNLVWVTPENVQIKGGVGPIISSGQYALKVTPEGISKCCNFMDFDDDIIWEPVFREDCQILSTGDYALKVAADGLYVCTNYKSSNPKWTKVRLEDHFRNQIG